MTAQVVLITGASTGFGHRSARRLADEGHHVFATMREANARNAQHAEALRTYQAQGRIIVVDLDVTDETSVGEAVAVVEAQAGRIDVLVNNAGIWGPGILEAFTIDQWQQVLDVNLIGSVRLMRAVLPVMRRQQSGLVVQISSLQGRFVLPYSGPYVASKYAVEAMAETFRYEVAPFGVEVCLIEPGDFMTEMKEKAAGYAATDTGVEEGYGPTGDFVRKMYLTPDPSRSGDPAAVVDAIAALIAHPAGDRPVRTTVGNFLPEIDEINATSERLQRNLLPQIGLGHLLDSPADLEGSRG